MKQLRQLGPVGPPESPPVRGRGLKHIRRIDRVEVAGSPPVRGRGLKHY